MQKFWQLWDRYRPWLQRFRWWLLAGGSLVAILTFTLIHAVSRPAAPSQVPRLAAEVTSQVSSTGKASSSSGKTPGGKQWVDIKGAVAHPGLYAFKEGDRVKQGIDLAGGLTPKADTVRLNLAQPLVDGQVVYILSQGEAASQVGGQARAAANPTGDGGTNGPVNLNTATSEQLQTLDGVGAKRAEKIITYRQEHGRFNQPSDLCQVDGIGDKFFQKIKDQVTV
ncbi:helix-hairpin-helix domain-containing protein [Lactobacillaceae bacterium L1_55_11]|nr:helix-hairpin-helix domain-containing protein [Lactobacillaceae bacterium L1_55_11]